MINLDFDLLDSIESNDNTPSYTECAVEGKSSDFNIDIFIAKDIRNKKSSLWISEELKLAVKATQYYNPKKRNLVDSIEKIIEEAVESGFDFVYKKNKGNDDTKTVVSTRVNVSPIYAEYFYYKQRTEVCCCNITMFTTQFLNAYLSIKSHVKVVEDDFKPSIENVSRKVIERAYNLIVNTSGERETKLLKSINLNPKTYSDTVKSGKMNGIKSAIEKLNQYTPQLQIDLFKQQVYIHIPNTNKVVKTFDEFLSFEPTRIEYK